MLPISAFSWEAELHPLSLARAAINDHGAIQKDAELAGFLAMVMDLDPEVIVEIGSDAGGTLWAWQQICPRVIGVDLPRAGFGSGARLNDHGCEIICGDSHDPATRDQLLDLLDGVAADMLFIDGDHTYEGAKADFELFSPLVRPGGMVGFHDICDHVTLPYVQVQRFWLSLDGDREDIVTWPHTWGGIGVLRVPLVAPVVAERRPPVEFSGRVWPNHEGVGVSA